MDDDRFLRLRSEPHDRGNASGAREADERFGFPEKLRLRWIEEPSCDEPGPQERVEPEEDESCRCGGDERTSGQSEREAKQSDKCKDAKNELDENHQSVDMGSRQTSARSEDELEQPQVHDGLVLVIGGEGVSESPMSVHHLAHAGEVVGLPVRLRKAHPVKRSFGKRRGEPELRRDEGETDHQREQVRSEALERRFAPCPDAMLPVMRHLVSSPRLSGWRLADRRSWHRDRRTGQQDGLYCDSMKVADGLPRAVLQSSGLRSYPLRPLTRPSPPLDRLVAEGGSNAARRDGSASKNR